MADVFGAGASAFNVSAVQSAGVQTVQTSSTIGFYLLIAVLLGALAFLVMYRRSFNIRVTIYDNRHGKLKILSGFKGKYTQVRPGEFRFRLYAAKSNKLRYNEEGLAQEDFYDEVNKRNKIVKCVYFTFDEEGQLIPIRIAPMTMSVPVRDEKGNPVLDAQGNSTMEETTRLRATVKGVDVAWFFKEYDKGNELFDAKSFMDKNGWIILAVLMLLILAAFCYTAFKFSDAAGTMASITRDQAQIISNLISMQNTNVTTTAHSLI